MKILHMADIHLGAEPDKGKPWGEERGQMLWQAFAQAIQAAQEQQVDLVLIAGDLFHRQPLKRELKEVNSLFAGLTRAKVVLMAGNHDYLSRNSFYRSFDWSENVYFFKSQQPEVLEFPELGVFLYGLSYEQREIRENLYHTIEKQRKKGIHILLAHGGDETHIPLKMAELTGQKFDYVALGHIHKPQQLVENRIVMAGSLQPLDYTEAGPHGYWIVQWKKEEPIAGFHSIEGFEYLRQEIVLDRTTTNFALQGKVREHTEGLLPHQMAVMELTGVYDPEVEPDVQALENMEKVAAVELTAKPDYDFEKLKQEYKDQMIARYIEKIEALPQDAVTKRALYLGVDALMGN